MNHALCIFAIGLAWTPGASCASPRTEPAKYDLKIASRALDEALQEFSRQSGVQIIYFSRLTEGLRAPALDGQYTLTGAMGALLAGSKLTFRVINSQTVEIKSMPLTGSLTQHPSERRAAWRLVQSRRQVITSGNRA
ncbi:MAG TPA: STN domain-containing protein [Steroidobacteraceae bacterium]|nr:STN domain-containing protein [Steroidobacteraceae bacterium]